MARSFNGSSDNIQQAVNLSAYTKLSISFWLNWTTFANDDKLAMEYSPNYGANTGAFIIDPNAGGPVAGVFNFAYHGTGGGVTVAHFTRPSAGAWHQYVFLIDASVSSAGAAYLPAAYMDGAAQSLTYDLIAAVSTGFGNFTLNIMSRNAASLFGAGSMADMTIWSILLTAGEAGALGRGARPNRIRPQSLVSWLPIDGLASPEPDLSGSKNSGTVTGAALASGPPMNPLTPRWPQLAPFTAIVAPYDMTSIGAMVCA